MATVAGSGTAVMGTVRASKEVAPQFVAGGIFPCYRPLLSSALLADNVPTRAGVAL
jgi:hypothetical protein